MNIIDRVMGRVSVKLDTEPSNSVTTKTVEVNHDDHNPELEGTTSSPTSIMTMIAILK